MSATRTPSNPTPPENVILPSSAPVPGGDATPDEPPAGGRARGGRERRAAPPARRPGTLLVQNELPAQGSALARRQAGGLPALGERLLVLGAGQQQWLAEVRRLAQDLEGAAPEDSRARMVALAQKVSEVIDWCAAGQNDLQAEAQRARAGEQAIDLLGLCQDVLHDVGGAGEGREVRILGGSVHTVWGTVAALGELVRLALELVDVRTGGLGDVAVEVGEEEGGPFVRIRGLGRARLEPPARLVEAFRSSAAAAGIEVRTDATTSDGAGMVLAVPADRRGPVVPRA